MPRRPHITLMLVVGIMLFLSLTYMMSSSPDYPGSLKSPASKLSSEPRPARATTDTKGDLGVPQNVLAGGAIAPKLENATAKAELGRASWKLLHTMMARFPEKPSEDDSLALKTYIQLFARLYPCGECAEHFRKLLDKYPPQVSGRNAAAGWACFVHNQVNKRLKKEQFDCNKIGDFYDCGCGDDDKKKADDGKKTQPDGDKKKTADNKKPDVDKNKLADDKKAKDLKERLA